MAISPAPAYTNDGTAGYVPAVWNEGLLTELDPQLVLSSPLCVNRDYEGAIEEKGDRVVVNSLVSPSVGDYDDGVGMTVEQLNTVRQDVDITEAYYVAFYISDAERVQAADALQAPAVQRSVVELAKKLDTYMGGVMAAGATANTALDVSAETSAPAKGEAILEHIFDQMLALDELDVPTNGRYAVVSPKAARYLVRAQAVSDASAFGESGATTNGVIARLAGFTLAKTTAMPAGVEVLVGHPMAATLAHQWQSFRSQPVEAYRRDQIDGLSLAGGKVIRHLGIDSVVSGAFNETLPSPILRKTAITFEAA